MKTDLYYFSATGNALWVARKIHEKLDGSNLISIPHALAQSRDIEGNIIGIVCPIYMYSLPHLVADFIRKITSAEYLFFVYAGAGELGNGIKDTLKLFKTRNLTLSALFNVPMPSNYTPYGFPTEEKQNELHAHAETKVEDIARIVSNRGSFVDSTNSSFFEANIHPGIFYRLGYQRINILDNAFSADEKCNGCAICQKVCPVGNITMKDNRPTWNNRCQQCYACLHWCPKESIQSGKRTVGIQRYHNPNITVQDIIGSSRSLA